MKNLTAAIMIIGNEILWGQTLDKNTQFLCTQLTSLGIYVQEVRIIRDEKDHIIKVIHELKNAYTYVFTTGGIGPTHDDITAQSVADALGYPLQINEEALKDLKEYYKDQDLTPGRLKMAQVPEGSTLIKNTVSGAPGFQVDNIFVLAGIPSIAQNMFGHLKNSLKQGQYPFTITLFSETSEGLIAPYLTEAQLAFPAVEIGSYPQWKDANDHGVSIVLKGWDHGHLERSAAFIEDTFEKAHMKVTRLSGPHKKDTDAS